MTKNISWITCIECVGNWELVVEYNLTLLNKFSWNNLLLLLLFCCFFSPLTLKLNTWRDQFEWTCCHVQNKLDNLLESFAKVFHTIPSRSCKKGNFFGWKKHILHCKKKILNFILNFFFTKFIVSKYFIIIRFLHIYAKATIMDYIYIYITHFLC